MQSGWPMRSPGKLGSGASRISHIVYGFRGKRTALCRRIRHVTVFLTCTLLSFFNFDTSLKHRRSFCWSTTMLRAVAIGSKTELDWCLLQPRLDKQLKELVEPDCTLRDLDLSLRGLGPDDFKAVAVALAHNASIFRVDLRRNKPELKGITV